MEVRPGYKQTEVGAVPEDWLVTPLTGLVAILHGFGFESRYFTSRGMYLLTTPGNFYEEGGFRDVGDKQKFYDGPLPDGFVLTDRDLIVAMTEQADGLLGSAALVPTSGIYLHNQRIGRVKVLSAELSIGFLYRIFNSNVYRAKVRETAAGTKVKHTSPARLLAIPVALPPTKSEQENIAEVLSDADSLIETLEQLIVKKRRLRQGALQALLTGQIRLPGFHEGWKPKRFSDLLKYERPDKYLVNSSVYVESSNTPVLTANKSFVLGHTNEEFGIYNDLPVIIFDDFTTDSKYVDFPFKVKSSAIKILKARSPETNLKFIFERMRLLEFPVGEHKRYYISEYQHIELPIPDPNEQAAISAVLTDVDAELVALEQRLAKTRDLQQAMMQELLTGKTRPFSSEASHA